MVKIPNFASGAAVGSAWGELQLKKTQFDRDLDDAERHFSKTANSMERRARKFRQNMEKAFTGIAVATAGLTAAMGGAVSMSAKFSQELVEVQKVTDPKTMRAMKEEIEDMANVMPLAHEGLTQIVADAGRMGIEGVKNLTAFTKTVAKLSVATELTAERAAKDLGKLTKWLNIPAKYAENLGAAINELSNNIPADADEIIRTLGKTGQQFEILGATTQTTLALSSAVSALADSAERGGTRMRRLLQQMQEPGTIADIAKAFGMTANEMERIIDNSPVKAIRMMAKAFKEGGTEAEKLRKTLASTSEVTLTILANNFDMFNNTLAKTGEQLKNPTSLLEEFKDATSTTIAQLKMLWNTIKNVFMNALGDQANQVLVEFIRNIRAWALTIEDLISNNEELQRAIFQVAKAILHLGGIITVIGLVGKAFFALMSPVTALITALMTLGALWRWNAWGMQEFIKNKFVKTFERFADAIGKLVKNLKDFPEKPFSSIAGLAKTIGENPVEVGIPLIITGLAFEKFALGGTISGALTGVLASGGMGSVSTGVLAVAGGFAVAIALPLIINEFSNEESKKEIKKAFEDSGFFAAVVSTLNNYPVSITLGAIYGGMAWGTFIAPAFSAITSLVASHIPWLYLTAAKAGYAIKGLTGPAIAVGGINLILGMAASQLAWEHFKTTGKGIIDEIVTGLSTALAGAAAVYFGYSVLGLTTGGTAMLGLGAITLALGITKLIPDLQLGGGAAQKISETVEEGLENEDIEVGLSPKVYLENLRTLTKGTGLSPTTSPTMIRSIAKQLSETEISKIETNLENFSEAIDKSDKKIADFGEDVGGIISILNRILAASEKGEPVTRQQGGFIKRQKGGMAGYVPGTGNGDKIPAMLEPGEFVWPKKMVENMPWIQNMWRGFREGGAVGAGRIFYGPDTGNEGSIISKVTTLFESWIEKPSESPFDPKNVELFKKDLGAVVTLFKKFSGVSADFDKTMEALMGRFKAFKEDMKGLTKETDIASLSLEDLNKKLKDLDVSQIGQLPEALRAITMEHLTKSVPAGALRGPGGSAPEDVWAKVEDWSLQRLETLQTFDNVLGPVTKQLVNLEDVANKYGVSQEAVQNNIDAVRDKFIRLTGSSEAFDKALEEAREGTEALAKIENTLIRGISGFFGGFSPLINAMLEDIFKNINLKKVTSGIVDSIGKVFQGIADKTGKVFKPIKSAFDLMPLSKDISNMLGSLASGLSQYAGPIIQVLINAFKTSKQWEQMQRVVSENLEALGKVIGPLLQPLIDMGELVGNVLNPILETAGKVVQAFADAVRWAINAVISIVNMIPFVHIDKVGKEAEDSEEQLRKFKDVLSTANSALRDFADTIGGFISNLLGPLGGAVDAIIGGIFDATSAIISNLDDPLAAVTGIFDALVGVATGLLDTFFNLVKQGDAYQALQDELEPVWKALAEAISSFLWPLVATIDWLKDFLGIVEQVSEEAKEIADAGVAQGFKRARAEWEAALPNEVPTVSSEDGGTNIPDWAKDVGKEIGRWIKDALGLEKNDNIFDVIEDKIRKWWNNLDLPDFSKWDFGPLDDFIDGVKWGKLETQINNIISSLDKVNWNTVGEELSEFLNEGLASINEIIGRLEDIFNIGNGDKDEGEKGIWGKILDVLGAIWETAVGIAKGIGGAAWEAVKTLAQGAWEGLKWIGDMAGSFLEGLGDLVGWLWPFQSGGIVTQPTPGIVGEAGPEAVIPLDRLDSMSQPQNVSVRLDIDGRELNSRLSKVDRRDEYTTHGSTRGKKGGYGRN